jgi:hypothetical protein
MNIKRIIAIIILLAMLVGSILIPCAVLSSSATSLQENEYSFETLPTETVTTPPTTTPPPQPTQSLLDAIIDTSIIYIKCEDKTALQIEIDKCNSYLERLETAPMSEVSREIARVLEILALYENDALYINKTIIDVPIEYTKKDFKSYEDYRDITSIYSPHYRLQHEYAYTGDDGIRMVNGRYCIALGSYFVTRIGQYVDIVLSNGTIIPCILGDQKADHHTGSLHVAHSTDSSVVEFIVDRKSLPDLPRKMGSISYSYSEWRSPVVQVIVYDINEFDK